ncbi:MAG: energy transducer TonB, partial [Pseudomonadales bacterium]|nr:energy transducer TonB [Pseudomonadales bacterium]
MAASDDTQAITNERLGFTLFVSICTHVVLILGVGFGIYEQFRPQPGLEITLARFRSEQKPEQADFLAQENQEGSGNLEQAAAPSTPVPAPFDDNRIQDVSPFMQPPARPRLQELPEQSLLSTQSHSDRSVSRQEQEENTLSQEDPHTEELSEAEMTEALAS